MTSFSHREFTVLLTTQKFTLFQMVDFRYNMDMCMIQIWSSSKIIIIMTHCWDITSSLPYKIYPTKWENHSISCNWANIRDRLMKMESQIHLKLVDSVTKYFWKVSSHRPMITSQKWLRHHLAMTQHFVFICNCIAHLVCFLAIEDLTSYSCIE